MTEHAKKCHGQTPAACFWKMDLPWKVLPLLPTAVKSVIGPVPLPLKEDSFLLISEVLERSLDPQLYIRMCVCDMEHTHI